MDHETRQKIKEAIDKHKRSLIRRTTGIRLSNVDPNARKRNRAKYKRECIRGCGRTAWHPPYGTGRCISCGVNESIPTRKPRQAPTSRT